MTILGPREIPRGVTRSLTAAGDRVQPRRDANTFLRLRQPWQTRSFLYYDSLGEIKYAAQFYARALSGVRLFVGIVNERGELEEPENAEEVPEEVRAQLDRVQDPNGGRSSLLGSYGRLMFLVGEALLFVTVDPDTDIEQWEMLSPDELRVTSDGYQRYALPGESEEYTDADDEGKRFQPVRSKKPAVAYRLWKRHPRYSKLPDATMQGVLDLCEELLLLTQAVRARARSRLAGAGILLVSNEFTPAAPTGDEADEDPAEDVFLAELAASMTEPIADEGSPSAVVPLIVRGPDSAIKDGMRHLQIVDPTQLYPETGLRRECIERIALGLDMPPEILLGLGDANHWSAWQVDEQTWQGHLAPVAQQLCDDLTSSFLRPTLKAENIEDWSRYAIGYDAAAVINHPDLSRNAKDLRSVGAISERALRDANGFTEDDAPDDEEWVRWLGVQVKDAGLAMTGVVTPAPEPQAPPSPPETVDPTPGGEQSDVEKGPPVAVAASSNGHATVTLHRILGAADLSLLRCREVAGNRIRNHVRKNPDLDRDLSGVAARDLPARVGADLALELGVPPATTLVQGTDGMILDALRVFGVGSEVAGQVARRVEEHAARTLWDERPPPLPRQFEPYVLGLLTGRRVAAPV